MRDLYDKLMALVASNEAFYYVDHNLGDYVYRVFTYRLASYSDFLLPGALECRGHMFRLDGDSVKLVSAPFEKFFNLNENPMVMDIDFQSVDFIHDKRDGSLISTFMHDGDVRLKSKTAVASDQALDATRFLHSNDRLLSVVRELAEDNYTVIMEYTAPDNRIVLPYQEADLRILGVRCNGTLNYIAYDYLYSEYGDLMVDDHTDSFDLDDVHAALEGMYDLKGIEGFVVGYNGGNRFKVKTHEYLSLHRAKDSIQSDKRLFEVALNDATDDLRTMFHDDQYTLDRISAMEKVAGHAYNHLVASVEKYHFQNQHLDRKTYAVRGQQELDRLAFNAAMMLYSGKQPDYKALLMKNVDSILENS